jgi:hypothetical protein
MLNVTERMHEKNGERERERESRNVSSAQSHDTEWHIINVMKMLKKIWK